MRGLLLVVLFGCAGVAAAPAPAPAPAPPPEHPLRVPLAVPGESMIYEVTFRGFVVGRVQVAIGQPGWWNGRPAIIVKSRGETDGLVALIGDLDWSLETTIDLETGKPLKSIEDAVVTFAGETKKNRKERDASETHTIHSAAAILRGWRSIPAQKADFEMRIDAALIDVDIHDAAREFIDVQNKPAVRYEGIALEKFHFKIWFSDDAARVPLKLRTSTKWGDVAVDLVEYNAPRD
jgi:hypothetical protein